jgi:SAM-dependent methyltransferase
VTTKQALRPKYQTELADGVAGFFEERRADCPLCGSTALTLRVTSPDIIQQKPGRFTLEQCGDCAHIFQNPMLNARGLDFYYRDAYDGLGAKSAEQIFALMRRAYRRRAEMVRAHTVPRAWLDVGTGFGHFCRTARQTWPECEFAGLDFGGGVLEARRRGWIDTAYQGAFPDLAAELAGRYDVVSMHHYLEHTTEPLREIDAAARVLQPGGHLLIEVPDPESRMAGVLGRHWQCWFQPQHLNLLSLANLRTALAERGFEVTAVDRRSADMGHDFVLAVGCLLNLLGPDLARPWAPRLPTAIDRLRRAAAITLAAPALLAALALDLAVRPLIPGHSNTYRVLATRL